MSQPASRLITLMMLLQRQPNQKAADLAARLNVSVRTLHRYMGMLDEMGIPIYTERGPQGGFSLVRGYKMPPLVFTPAEATALYLGANLVTQLWGTLYHEAAGAALAKLENVLPDEQRREAAWAQRALVATGLQHVDVAAVSPSLEVLRQAAHQQRRVTFRYHGSRGQPRGEKHEERALDVYALVFRGGWWYAVGFCPLRGALRTFRLDRMEAPRLTELAFSVPPDFDVHAYLATAWPEQAQIATRFLFQPAFAHIARANRAAWETFEEQPDGSIVVALHFPDLIWAASMALAYGPGLVVLEPPELRTVMRAWALAIANHYRDPQEYPETKGSKG